MKTVLLGFFIALAASLTFTIFVRQLAIRIGMVDVPAPRKVHVTPIPLLGGIAIYTSVVLSLLMCCSGQDLKQLLGFIAGATLLLFVGVADDAGLLHHQVKLFVAMPLASGMLLASGVRAHIFSSLLRGRGAALADAALVIFWVTALTASFSILDYMDGVCAGLAAIACSFSVILAAFNQQPRLSALAAIVAGAAFGFLRWNFSPARIFMGDGGAMFLGFSVAALTLNLHPKVGSPGAVWFASLLVVAVPILDTTLVSLSRIRRGLVPFTSPGKDHIGHRLANSGLGHRGAVLTMYGAAVVFGGFALVLPRLTSVEILTLCLIALGVLFASLGILEYMPYERQQPGSKSS